MSSRPSLRHRILLVYATSTVLASVLLTATTLIVAGFSLRALQDRALMDLARSLGRNVQIEGREHDVDIIRAATVAFHEFELHGHTYELVTADGRTLVASAEGDPRRGTSPIAQVGCASVHAGPTTTATLRACTARVNDRFFVRVATADDLRSPAAKRTALALLAMLPLCAAFAWLVGRRAATRTLAPLVALQAEANVLEPGDDLRLASDDHFAEIYDLRAALNLLLGRLDAAIERERRFAQEASHELRTPLTVLRARLEWLAAQPIASDPRWHEELRASLAALGGLERLVDSLLLLSRSEADELQRDIVNLSDIAHEQAAQVGATHGVVIDVSGPDELLVEGNEELLGAAVRNIIDNACKYGGSGRPVSVTIRASDVTADLIVEDEGPGIPGEALERVFERFYRAPRDRRRVAGSGLGLAVARMIVLRHGGDIAASRREPQGTRVTLRLPQLTAASLAHAGL